MRSRCGGVIGSKRPTSTTHPIVMFRMRNNRTLVVKNEMRTVENAKWYISSISGVYRILPHPIYTMYISRDFTNPPPLGMGGGGDIRIVLSCTLIFYGDVTNYPYVCFFTRRNIILP